MAETDGAYALGVCAAVLVGVALMVVALLGSAPGRAPGIATSR